VNTTIIQPIGLPGWRRAITSPTPAKVSTMTTPAVMRIDN
jgi:hypothetical protein